MRRGLLQSHLSWGAAWVANECVRSLRHRSRSQPAPTELILKTAVQTIAYIHMVKTSQQAHTFE
ncbi:hypothetical protein M2401_001851 [Pseudomonas sp. JUb42]|jgi:hypothetical protein|nr:hypothetical protein [Pseudomonas sp. JUb42]